MRVYAACSDVDRPAAEFSDDDDDDDYEKDDGLWSDTEFDLEEPEPVRKLLFVSPYQHSINCLDFATGLAPLNFWGCIHMGSTFWMEILRSTCKIHQKSRQTSYYISHFCAGVQRYNTIFRPRRSRSAAAYSHQTFPCTICRSVCLSVQCIVEKRQIASGSRLAP